jgi:glycosyltransferase involved in cell wall biosynthesis
MADKKFKILTISDHPLIPSGVGLQTRYLIEGLLKTGKYKFVSWGAAIKHQDYRPVKIEGYGDDWVIWPIDGYGDRDRMRMTLLNEKPDAVLIHTDPRFFQWLFEMGDEINKNLPLFYWHIWDNDPTPVFNAPFYDTTDYIVTPSLKTHGLIQDMRKRNLYAGPEKYIPYAEPTDLFFPMDETEVMKFRREKLGPHWDKKFIVFWNNRNARRKMSGDVVVTFAKFAEKVGKQNVALFLQTQVHDPEGQDLLAVAKMHNIDSNLIISEQRVPTEEINRFYNAADVTINISNNEGFGLGTMESMLAGTPIIVHMTGGLQFQTGDWWEEITDFSDQEYVESIAKSKWKKKIGLWTGVPVFPASRSCTGGQPIPFIYDDRVAHADVVDALVKMYNMTRQERKQQGLAAREWVKKAFPFDKMISNWDEVLSGTIPTWKRHGGPRIVTL